MLVKGATEAYSWEASYKRFTANMQQFMMDIIYVRV